MTKIIIPTALSDSNRWNSLNKKQRQFLENKLLTCSEIADRSRTAVTDVSTPLLELIDDNELDGLSCMGGAGNVQAEVSLYQLHSSWTSDFDALQMAAHADEQAISFLSAPRPSLVATQAQHRQWVSKWGHQLNCALIAFNSSNQFASSVAALLLIDALVLLFLSYAPIARFSIAYPD